MSKQSFTHYYVQAQKKGEMPEIIYHSQDEDTKEYYHKFLDRKKAQALAEAEKAIFHEIKFRVVKCTETYDAGLWI